MTPKTPLDELSFVVELREPGQSPFVNVTALANGTAIGTHGPAIANDLFATDPGPLEAEEALAFISRCSQCGDLDCGYSDVLVTRSADGVSWCVRSLHLEWDVETTVPKRHGRSTRTAVGSRWMIDDQQTYMFAPSEYDAAVAAARAEVARLQLDG